MDDLLSVCFCAYSGSYYHMLIVLIWYILFRVYSTKFFLTEHNFLFCMEALGEYGPHRVVGCFFCLCTRNSCWFCKKKSRRMHKVGSNGGKQGVIFFAQKGLQFLIRQSLLKTKKRLQKQVSYFIFSNFSILSFAKILQLPTVIIKQWFFFLKRCFPTWRNFLYSTGRQ